jgi:hypothetical protein
MQEIVRIIPYYLSVFISALFYNLCYIKLNNHKIKYDFKFILIIALLSLLIFLNNSYINLWIKAICVPLVTCASFKILYKDNFTKTIISYILIFIFIVLLEIIFTNILFKAGILNNYSEGVSYTRFKLIFSILISITEYLFFSVLFIKQLLSKLIEFFCDNINSTSIAYLLFITGVALGILNVNNFAEGNSTQLIFILIAIFSILFIIIIKSKTQEEYLKKSNKKLIEYNEKYSQFLDEYKIYKHNINHKIAGMKAFGNKKVNALIDDLLEEETNFSIKNNNLYNIPNGIKGIVAEKLYDQNFDVLITNKIKNDPFINLSPKSFNSISECIGIALDNAIEASEKTKEPVITMDLYEENNDIFIKIGNNFCNNIDIDKLGQKYYSTKNRGSGLGLFSIRHNKIVKEKISIINNIFYIELSIKKNR